MKPQYDDARHNHQGDTVYLKYAHSLDPPVITYLVAEHAPLTSVEMSFWAPFFGVGIGLATRHLSARTPTTRKTKMSSGSNISIISHVRHTI